MGSKMENSTFGPTIVFEIIEKAMVEKYFGVIPRGPEVKSMKLRPVRLDADRYVSYVDNNIRFPALLATYPTVSRFHPDEAPLDFLAQILGTGRSSYLFKKFILTQKAIQASVFHPVSELAGEFTMFVLPFPGQTLADFEQEMRTILDEFASEGVSDNDLAKSPDTNREISIFDSIENDLDDLDILDYILFKNNTASFLLDFHADFVTILIAPLKAF